jgi:hypothetical protein
MKKHPYQTAGKKFNLGRKICPEGTPNSVKMRLALEREKLTSSTECPADAKRYSIRNPSFVIEN